MTRMFVIHPTIAVLAKATGDCFVATVDLGRTEAVLNATASEGLKIRLDLSAFASLVAHLSTSIRHLQCSLRPLL